MNQTLDIWRPDRAVFLRRSLLVTVAPATLLCLLFAVLTGYWKVALLFGALAICYFAFNDMLAWRAARGDRWELTETNLLHHGTDGESQLALADITDVGTRFGWTVIVTQKNGLSIEIPYVTRPDLIAQRILATRAGLLG